ncbi:hypothetical protein GCM10010917_12540 [Paenibacillus physcomitrellae]|uniref:Uncharacterized protein n=2 Tax=Paenibacillus physcomitrellae TaxID=1619311 RepID=A0ABQ1FSD4_9BACL|nr:hypothetical protein GCM10010917_12540 [Paenibacillus physcomitrellae]
MILDEKLRSDKLTVTFEVTGERINEQIEQIWLYDQNGNPLPRVNPPIRIKGSDRYETTFSNVSRIDSVEITTPVFNPIHYYEELAVTVDMKERQ